MSPETNCESEPPPAVEVDATFHLRLRFDPPSKDPSEGWTRWLQGKIHNLEQKFPKVIARRLFVTLPARIYGALGGIAEDRDLRYRFDSDPSLNESLLRYFALDCPQNTDLAGLQEVLSAPENECVVQVHYAQAGVPLPRCGQVNVRRICGEGHLEAAPEGIDAKYAWGFPGADGVGLRLVDVERGWGFLDSDLHDAGVAVSSGVNVPDDEATSHGTAVLGIVAATRNTNGTNGIASGVSSIRLVSIQRDQATENMADAILAAIGDLRFGDVLLLEIQARYDNRSPFRPVEVERAVFEVIRFATALGVVVIEPAGNGASDLDLVGLIDRKPTATLDRRDVEASLDSGAILVSASCRPPAVEADGTWNFGSRVDCHAWGEIWTLTTKRYLKVQYRWLGTLFGSIADPDLFNLLRRNLFLAGYSGLVEPYADVFTDTSAASAVIAGAALSVQGMARAHLGYRFSPWQLRLILSDPANGTPPQVPQKGNIGVMPDLKKVVRGVLNIPADLYLRDRLGDTGESPRGRRMESPDILTLAQPPECPQKEFGEGSHWEDDDLTRVSARPEAGQLCYVGLRVRNRGGREAEEVRARIFCAPAATLLVPSLWQEVGTVTLPSVPEADQLTVSGFLDTQVPRLPEELDTKEYRAWIALLDHPDDPPQPDLDKLDEWKEFLELLHEDNNFAVRNLHRVPHAAGGGEKDENAWLKLPFLVAGELEKRLMRIEVLSRLPRDCQVWIDMPPEFCDLRQVSSVIVPSVFCSKDLVQLPVNPNGKHYFREVLLDPGQTYRLSLWVHVPPPQRHHAYRIAVRQICEGEEVGRVTWRLMPT